MKIHLFVFENPPICILLLFLSLFYKYYYQNGNIIKTKWWKNWWKNWWKKLVFFLELGQSFKNDFYKNRKRKKTTYFSTYYFA